MALPDPVSAAADLLFSHALSVFSGDSSFLCLLLEECVRVCVCACVHAKEFLLLGQIDIINR